LYKETATTTCLWRKWRLHSYERNIVIIAKCFSQCIQRVECTVHGPIVSLSRKKPIDGTIIAVILRVHLYIWKHGTCTRYYDESYYIDNIIVMSWSLAWTTYNLYVLLINYNTHDISVVLHHNATAADTALYNRWNDVSSLYIISMIIYINIIPTLLKYLQ